ncbi:adenylyl-sulfate kinase [Pseudomonas sp. 10B1]|uniref:adenylyl-sulfate kinase n=1 Tax=unclassified Pseudomonas TaxID=196821 RepID=UPI002B238643|nr:MULTISPECIES: adenylyl-sulfate kinase [unclassified Pseudomonas]MEA9997076.1 adenylyl-sulfate kinase [Pseudomonas sp. AA4]MEB0087726.1 adenylyl-sulfate kinase [Pseudomonas sp. RTI1]MEB0124848.1 adenylyl-sulfate kinase [Pseudomonas sp. CCC1.2]MEB0155739.1 adenylyl-sulfate kinase [Pseudomonas sp. CCC4.3]MEB0217779.1 adenylyl-sulfate kinase [Pseudomonas sp. AB12(2023)]
MSDSKVMQDKKFLLTPTHSPLGSVVFWLTGISGAGKTTIADSFEKFCRSAQLPIIMLDGDIVRCGLNSDLGFTEKDRSENIRRIAEVAALMADAKILVIVACISPSGTFRNMARKIIGEERFIEVHIDTPLVVAEKRDPKGLYSLARSGKLLEFTGIHLPYEAPHNPQIRIDTMSTDVGRAVEILFLHLIRWQQGVRQPRKPSLS